MPIYTTPCVLLIISYFRYNSCITFITCGPHDLTTLNMAKRVKSISSLIDELDKPLYEGRWREIEQTLKKSSKKSAIPEAFSCFAQGEEQLDNYLLGKLGGADLREAESKLKQALELCQPGHDAALQQLAKIKYGQLLWLQGAYIRALATLQEGVQQCTPDTTLMHTCKVLVEGNLYLGLCLEHVFRQRQTTSEISQALGAYEQSLQLALALLHLTRISTIPRHPAAFKAIKAALERGPLLALKLNRPGRALNLFRRVLQSRDEDILLQMRQVCTSSLASLLLFHGCPASHNSPSSSSISIAAPGQLQEEAILACFLAKSYVDTWTVSKAEPVPSPAIVFDLLTLSLSDVKLRGQLIQVLEDSMRFSSVIPHVWMQFALALVAGGQNAQALAVFHECINLSPEDPLMFVTAADFAVEKMDDPHLCLKWATKASSVSKGHFLEPRVEFLLGRAYTILSERELSSQKRGELHKQGLRHLKQAVQLDQQSVDFSFHFALQLAQSRELLQAITEVRRALSLNAGHTSCLHLLALILSAQKQYIEALKVCDFALQKQPENFGLLECKIKLEVVTNSSHQALKTCKHSLQLWQSLFSDENSGLIGLVTQDQRSLSDIPLAPYERAEGTISPMMADVASDAGSSHFSLSASHTHTNQPNLLQAKIWCTVAEVFLSAGKVPDAISCVREAQYLGPHLPKVLVTHGRVLEREGRMEQALEQYRNALVLQPINLKALTLVGQVLHMTGKHVEAEKYLREATSIHQLNHEAWYWLGEVFNAQNQHELSADCFKTALDLEQTAPIQTFSAVLSSLIPPS